MGSIVSVIMGRCIMSRVIVVMGSMLARMFVAVVSRSPCVAVGMAVLVAVGVAVHVLMGMAVRFSAVLMGVFMLVLMLVAMVVVVFVVAFHEALLFFFQVVCRPDRSTLASHPFTG
jgi:hypothetical protein